MAVKAIAETDLPTIKKFLREQIDMLNGLIERSESEEAQIYEWAKEQQ